VEVLSNLWSVLRALLTAGRGTVRGLSEESAGTDPLALFHRWFEDAKAAGLYLPESMSLATAGPDGQPSGRHVLLKAYDERGFVFYTNYGSRKAKELDENPRAALTFHWPVLQRQVRIEGVVGRISAEESDAYFRTRPRGSQLGAWASAQSEVVASREELDRRFRELEREYRDRDIPRPPFWGGYRLRPERIEFWQGRINRLHDRILFRRTADGWERVRLYP